MTSTNSQQPGLSGQQLQGVFTLYSMGRLQEALAAANKLDREHPQEPVLLNLLGAIQAGLEDYDAAITSFQQAIELRPDVADSHFHLGNMLFEKGDLGEALQYFERALELRPDYLDAHNKLCQGLERGNQIQALDDALAHAQKQCPGDHPALSLREAELLKRKGDFATARTCLENSGWRTADPETQETAAYLLCDLCDRLGDVDAAYAFAEDANRICRSSFAAQRTDAGAYLRLIDELTQVFENARVGEWSKFDVDDSRQDPVFLVGFPRSGTTLLDTILRSHDRIAVVEEVPTVYRLESEFLALMGSYADGLRDIDVGQVESLRQVYFTELDNHVSASERSSLVIDKLPLNLVQAGLIHRIFPHARFLFAERHPCDSVLSCFMRAFKINEGMIHFLDLSDAAKLYDRVMSLWTLYRDKHPLSVHTVRYETLISDFEGTVSPCLQFLGLDWDDGVRNYVETAKRRGRISTPSYNQVTQALYSDASGRWQRYRKHLEPVLPVLQPWAQRMGYGD